MEFVKIEGATHSLGAPVGWDESKDGTCGVLHIRVEQVGDSMPRLLSEWKPSAAEAALLAAGAPIFLSVVGHSHPPVMLSVGEARVGLGHVDQDLLKWVQTPEVFGIQEVYGNPRVHYQTLQDGLLRFGAYCHARGRADRTGAASDAARVVYAEQRRDFWINEAQRLAAKVRDLGGDAEPLAVPPEPEQVVPDQQEEALRYAESLARVLYEKHWKVAAPEWQPLAGDLIGLLSQIDNMTAGLMRRDIALASAPPAPTPDAGSDLAGLSHEDAETLAWVAQELAGRGQVKAAGVVSKAMVFGRLNSASPPPGEDLAGQGEPVAWEFETFCSQKWTRVLSAYKPSSEGVIRNIRPLYAAPAPSRPADREEIAKALKSLRERGSNQGEKRGATLGAKDPRQFGLGYSRGYHDALDELEALGLADAPRDAGAWPPAGWTATPVGPPGYAWRLTKDPPSPNPTDGTQDTDKGGER